MLLLSVSPGPSSNHLGICKGMMLTRHPECFFRFADLTTQEAGEMIKMDAYYNSHGCVFI